MTSNIAVLQKPKITKPLGRATSNQRLTPFQKVQELKGQKPNYRMTCVSIRERSNMKANIKKKTMSVLNKTVTKALLNVDNQ